MNKSPSPNTDFYLRTAVEYSPNGLLMIDSEGRIVLANREIERLFQYSRDELVGQSCEILLPARFREGPDGPGRKFFHRTVSELPGRRKDGSEFPVELSLNEIETEEGFCILGSVVDLDARRKAEQQFRVAVESAPSGMVMIDASGAIILVNCETERLFGYTRDELLGRSIEMLVPGRFRAKHPQYREEFYVRPSARLMGGGRDLYGLRKDGTEIPVEIGLNPIQTDEGLMVLSAIVDISERKRAEEALRQTTEELKRSNQQLEQFAYVASHDLQEPLRAIIGFLQLLDERYKPSLDGKAGMYVDYAVEGAKRMSRLINDLLDYSRVERRGQKIQAVDLNDSFRIATANLRASIEEAAASITSDELPTVDGNEMQLVQLFQNLLGNAIKFRRKEMPLLIHVGCSRQNDRWLVSVRDNGIGIAPEFREKVFLIFQRLHGQKEYPGTGIGLAVCKKIVEQHGGRIWIESDPNEGSTFYFTLPITGDRISGTAV